MNILLTGLSGGLGRETAQVLAGKGHRVIGNTRQAGHRPDDLGCADIIVADINQGRSIGQALLGADAVVHLAALTGFQQGLRGYVESNLMTTASLLDIIRSKKIPVKKIIYASSAAIYGEGAYSCADHGLKYPPMRTPAQLAEKRWALCCPVCGTAMKPVPTREDKPPASLHAYGITKHASEAILQAFSAEYGVPVISLRFPVLYGPAQPKGIMPLLFNRINRYETIALNEDGAQRRDYLFNGDAAQAIAFALETLEMPGVFNVSCGAPVSLLQLVNAVEACVDQAATVEVKGNYRANDVRHIFLDSGKMEQAGFHAGTSLAMGLEKMREKLVEGTPP